MKKVLTILLISILGNISFAAECTREASSWVKPNGGYDITGTVTFRDSNGVKTLIFSSNFSTLSGPDIYIYLGSKNANPTNVDNDSYELAYMPSQSGAQEYDIPSSIDISDYDYVLIHCKQYNHFWGGGQLGSINGTCATSLDQLIEGQIIISANKITNNTGKNLYYSLINLQGKSTKNGILSETLTITGVTPGVYILIVGDIRRKIYIK